MHLLIPDLLLPRAHVRSVLADLDLPGLTAVLRDADPIDREGQVPEFQRSMPATRWLLRAFGLESRTEHATLAPVLRAADGLADDGRDWQVALLCHYALARDHVQLGADRLALPGDEALALLETARPILVESGVEYVIGRDARWYLHDPQLAGLCCAEPARGLGRNIDVWLPTTAPDADPAPARRWRRLHNELQMLWHEHPVNQAREARGDPAVNGIWLYGGGRMGTPIAAPRDIPALAPRADQATLNGLARLAQTPVVARDADARALIVLDELSESAVREDWEAWRQALLALDRDWFVPLAARRTPLTLTLCSETAWQTLRTSPGRRWKFWQRKTLAEALGT